MKSFLVKTPMLVQRMYPTRIWAFPEKKNTLFLTFDDGPIPEVTPWVLDTLNAFQAKATFFCIGENIRRSPELFGRILAEGHSVGNHTFNHLKGWKANTQEYIENVALATEEMESVMDESNSSKTKFFRPPYGKIKSKQADLLQKKGYKIVMWDVLSFDFDTNTSPEQCFENVSENIDHGSIIVFHDSLKAEKNLRFSLPKVLELAVAGNYELQAL